jgi:3',5'-cyclic AMP phosphodiesterase CpdA
MRAGFLLLLLCLQLPLLWSCCPTLWLQVNKDNPAPWPSIAVSGIEETMPFIPASAPNRFDVLAGGRPIVAASDFTDDVDPKDDQNGAFSRALRALASIEQQYGAPAICPDPKAIQKAQLLCAFEGRSGLEAKCHYLHFNQDVAKPAGVVIRGRRLAVLNQLTPSPSGADLDLSEYVPGTAREWVDVCFLDELPLSRTLLSFIHMSDVQLRDPSITLGDRRISRQLDWFDELGSFEYDEDLAFYNQYLVEAVVASINAMVRASEPPDRPRFIIHTGDSIDSGAMSELARFHTLIDRLRIPFYEAFGNHDLLVFGNLTPTETHDSDATCAPVASLLGSQSWLVPNKLCVDQRVSCPTCMGAEGELVARATQSETRERFMQQLAHVRADRLVEPEFKATGVYCPATRPKVRNDAATRAHGFDLGTANDSLEGPKLGYYAFVSPLAGTDRKALFVGLNSEDLEDGNGGIGGRIGSAQRDWLERVLACVEGTHGRDLVFVFAHQPPSKIQVAPYPDGTKKTLAEILGAHRNVVGYLYGHSHRHEICGDKRPGVCSKFWEVQTASLVEFPQEGRLVRVKQVSEDLAFLELTAIRERLADQGTELARYVALARRGAERDYCHTKRGTKVRCSADQRPYRADGHDANARLFFRLP